MGNPENGRRAEGDQQRLQADLMQQVGGLFENFLRYISFFFNKKLLNLSIEDS